MEVDDDTSVAKTNANAASDDASMIIDVAADGDIIMVVGPKKRKFRVHSTILTSTSKVFRAMLSPNFAEGRQLRNNGHHGEITNIKLPEDNADGMSAIFCLLHHRVDKIPDPVPARLFFHISVAADKYDLVPTLKYSITGAIHRTVNNDRELKDMKMLDVWYLVMTAASFDDHTSFATLTHALVWYCDKHFVQYAEKAAIDELFAYRLCGLLEMKRSSIRSYILQEVMTACTEDDDGTQLTEIRCDHGGDDEWKTAKIFAKGSLYDIWDYIDMLNMTCNSTETVFDEDSLTWVSGNSIIRRDGKILLEDVRKPQAKNGTDIKRP